jgi:methylmalonyl-CoA mutase, C-terminal domain
LKEEVTLLTGKKVKVIMAKLGLDGHDRGAKLLSRVLAEAGMEVVYTGLRQTPEMIVETALQEDADVIGLSSLSGAHAHFFPRVMQLLQEKKMDKVLVVGGGIIPEEDVVDLKKAGIAAIFGPGTPTGEIVSFIKENVQKY